MTEIDWEEIAKISMEQADKKFANQISSLTTLTDEEVAAVAPEPPDQEKLTALLKEVADATKSNQKKAEALGNLTKFVDIIFPLLKTALKL